jgi:hypothetical protein
MKNYVLFLFIYCGAFAQDKNSSVEKNLFKLNLLTPGITYELGLAKKVTLNSDLNLGLTFFAENENSSLKLFPFIREQIRYYYNLEKRSNKNKNILNNSGNFLAVNASYYSQSLGDVKYVHGLDGFTIAPVWGLQRTFNSGINITVNTGVGYNFSSHESVNDISPIINFTLGWVIN